MLFPLPFLLSILTFATFSSASLLPPRNAVISRDTTVATRNIIWVDGPDQGTNDTDNGSPVDLTQLLTHSTRVTHVILSSAHINNPSGQPPYINFWSDLPLNSTNTSFIWPQVQTLQSAGVKVLLSLGGAEDGSWGHLTEDFDLYYAPLLQALKEHGFDGVDLDVETDYSTAGAFQLLQKLNEDLGSDFLLTMSPVQECLSSAGECSFGQINYQSLDTDTSATYPDRENGKLVSFYNAQFYSGGGNGANSPDDYEAVVNAGFAAERVILGVAACSVDGTGWYPLSTLDDLIATLKGKYGDKFGGVFGWDWNNAGSCEGISEGWEWVKSLGDILYGSTTSTTSVVATSSTSAVAKTVSTTSAVAKTVSTTSAVAKTVSTTSVVKAATSSTSSVVKTSTSSPASTAKISSTTSNSSAPKSTSTTSISKTSTSTNTSTSTSILITKSTTSTSIPTSTKSTTNSIHLTFTTVTLANTITINPASTTSSPPSTYKQSDNSDDADQHGDHSHAMATGNVNNNLGNIIMQFLNN